MSGFTRAASLPPSSPADVGAAQQPLAAPVWPQTAGACDQLLIDPGPGHAHWTVDYVRQDELSGGQTLVNLEDVVRMRFPTMAENQAKARGHIAFMLNKVATAIRVPRDLLVHDRPARAIVGDADVQLERAVDSQVHVTPSTMLSYVETGDTKSGWNGDSKALLVAGLKRLQLVAAAQGSGGGAVVDLLRRYSELESPDMQSFLSDIAGAAGAGAAGVAAFRVLEGHFENYHKLKNHEFVCPISGGRVKNVPKTAYDMLCQQFVGRSKGCTFLFAQGYGSAHANEYTDMSMYSPCNINLEYQDMIELLRLHDSPTDEEAWASSTGGCKGSPLDGIAWDDRLVGILHMRLCLVAVLINKLAQFWDQRGMIDLFKEWLLARDNPMSLIFASNDKGAPTIFMRGGGDLRLLAAAEGGQFFDDFENFCSSKGEFIKDKNLAAAWTSQMISLNKMMQCAAKMDSYLKELDVQKLPAIRLDWNRQAVAYSAVFKSMFGTVTPKMATLGVPHHAPRMAGGGRARDFAGVSRGERLRKAA